MKVFQRWEIIQLFVEPGEATGKIWLVRKQKLATNSIIYMFSFTWHDAKIVITNVKTLQKSLMPC
jgi:hypothetical protein